jgi:hypothetical protein
MRQKLVLSLRAGFLGDFQMNDRWGLLPIWLKLAMAAMFAVMVFFAVGSLVLGRWATALVSWAIVLAVVALFGPFRLLTSSTGRLSKAQVATGGVAPLAIIWLGRFISTGDRSPFLLAGILVLVAGLAIYLVTEGWSGRTEE